MAKSPTNQSPDPSLELEAWKATIDVQKHFNDLAMRVRGLAITVLGAFLAAAGYGLSKPTSIAIAGSVAPLSGVILASGFVVWVAFYVMDRMWYHRLLKAAVKHGRGIEDRLKLKIPSVSLTTTIDEESPLVGLRAGARLSVFYMSIAAILYVGAATALKLGAPWYLPLALLIILIVFAELKGLKKRKVEVR